MSDLVMLKAEMDRSKVELQMLQEDIRLICCSQPIDLAAVEGALRRLHDLAEYLEAVTRALLEERSSALQ